MNTKDAETRKESNLKTDGLMTEEFREFLKTIGADLVGFGSVDDMEGAPEIMQPRRYMPDAKSIIVLGLHINEASCDLIERSIHEDTMPVSYHSYQLFTLIIINPQLDEMAYKGAKYLEDMGYRAYPFPANVPRVLKPSELYPGGPADVSNKHMAMACGLGYIGWHNLLITPEFGSRQKLITIISNAPLKADPMSEKNLCDPVECGFQCSKACPTDAIPEKLNESVSLKIREKNVEYAKMIGWKCRWGCSGMLKCVGGYTDVPMPDEEPDEFELIKYKDQMDPWQQRMRNYTGLTPYCGRCLVVCPAGRN